MSLCVACGLPRRVVAVGAFSFLCVVGPPAARAQTTPAPAAPRVFRASSEGLVLATRPETPLGFLFVDRGVRYRIEVARDGVSGHADDRVLAAERLQIDGPQVEVLDADGAVIARITTTATGGSVSTFPHRHRVTMGVRLLPVTTAQADAVHRDAAQLRLVGEVVPGLGAAAAGVLAGDVLCAIDGGPVGEERLRAVLAGRKPGESVPIQVLRRGTLIAFDVALTAAPPARGGPARAPTIEFRDGMLVVLDPQGEAMAGAARGAPDVGRELATLAQRVQELEAVVRRLADKNK